MNVPGVREETVLRYKVNGSAEDDRQVIGASSRRLRRRGASPFLSMVRDSSATVVSGASRIPFERSSRIRRFPWRYRSSTMVEEVMAVRKREDEVFPNAAGIDIGASSHWVAVPPHEVLEQRGLKVWLVDARQMKYVPGRKSDVQDCQWLQKLVSLGLLRAAWRPASEVCVVLAVARQREILATAVSRPAKTTSSRR